MLRLMEGSLEVKVKLPTIWTDAMQSRKSEEKVSESYKMLACEKVIKFPMICGSGGSKSRLAKAAGAEPAGQRRD